MRISTALLATMLSVSTTRAETLPMSRKTGGGVSADPARRVAQPLWAQPFSIPGWYFHLGRVDCSNVVSHVILDDSAHSKGGADIEVNVCATLGPLERPCLLTYDR
ncbi:exported hypothetical protein [Acidobacteriia bacterium SbA2]|nr:exported hypothetical protein [Acidobacteriia bacterium SbA2]